MISWEYTSVGVDAWLPLGVQGGVKYALSKLGNEGWEAFGVTPATPPTGTGVDPDQSEYEVLLKRPKNRAADDRSSYSNSQVLQT